MNNVLKIAVLLTAVDDMSNTVQNAVNKSQNALKGFEGIAGKLGTTALRGMAAQAAIDMVEKSVKAYATLQEAQLDLKSTLLKDGNRLNTDEFNKLNALAVELGNKLPGATEDFERMFAVMIKSGAEATQILNGAGTAAAYVAVATDQQYSDMAKSVIKFQHATGIADKDLVKFMDIIARTKNLDVEIGEMQYAFGRSAGALKTLGLQGLESAKSLSTLFALLISNGQTGETVGTGFSTLTRTLMDKGKLEGANQALSKYGIQLQFLDKQGKFTIENMVNQFNKLQKIKNIAERESILKSIFGGGNDQTIAEILISEGNAGFNRRVQKMAEQAELMDKANLKLSGQTSKWEALTGTVQNIFAGFGQNMSEDTDWVLDNLNKVASKFQELQQRSADIERLWKEGKKEEAHKLVLFDFPAFLDKWIGNPVAAFVSEIQEIGGVWGQAFYEVGHYSIHQLAKGFRGVGWFITELVEAGKRMALYIAKGIGEGFHYVTDKVSELTKNVREYFPFSPAKRGALRDIHRIKLMETIASSIKPNPVINAVNSATNNIAGKMSLMPAYAAASSGSHSSGVTLQYSPTIYMGSGTNKSDFGDVLRTHAEEIERMIEDIYRRKERTKLY